jgi:hypothetical protein
MTKQADGMAEVDLHIFCTAARIAFLAGDDETYTDAVAVLAKRARKMSKENSLIKDLLKRCQSPSEKYVIPFVIDKFTEVCVACFFPENALGNFIVYSDYSKIEAGYLVCKSKGVRYVDRMLADQTDLELPVFPKYAVTPELLDGLSAIDAAPPEIAFAKDSGDTLEVRWTKDASNLFSDKQSSASLTILNISASGQTLRRSLSKVKISKEKSKALSIALNGEQQLEVHAASFNGGWLFIEDDDQSLLCRIPSLDLDAKPEIPWISSTRFRTLMNKHPYSPIEVPYALASKLMKRHQWFSCTNRDHWFRIASASIESTGTQNL